jgi:hypothetical protein
MTMNTLIDWLSFTIPAERGFPQSQYRQKVELALHDFRLAVPLQYSPAWEQTGGRANFKLSYDSGNGIRIFVGADKYILVEMSGQGCETVRAFFPLEELLKKIWHKVTRIDLASDMHCNTKPETFVACSDAKRLKSLSVIKSVKGTTIYIGSKASERFARVYRYAEPHPRHEFLRCEMVYRKAYAGGVAKSVITSGLETATSECGEQYGWQHPEWTVNRQNTPSDAKIRLSARDRNDDKTVKWLIAQASPAFRRCVKTGAIENPSEFVREHFS